MSEYRATARACSNIAFIKYWGKDDYDLNLPMNDSVSMCLSEAYTTTTVIWEEDRQGDEIWMDGELITDKRSARISRHLDRIRSQWYTMGARVATTSSFPAGTGIASSASGFAALSAAAIAAFGEGMPSDEEMSKWARRGSGSASRSIHAGYVYWKAGSDESSAAEQLVGPGHWDLRDFVVIVSGAEKEISSSQGHKLAAAHPFMPVRQELLKDRLTACTQAIINKDFETFSAIIEHEAMEMHGIMMSSTPSCLYPVGGTLDIIHALRGWRREGLPVCFTLDAGPNVHIIVEGKYADEVQARLDVIASSYKVLHNRPGPGITYLDRHLL